MAAWTSQRTGNWNLISSNAASPWHDGGSQTALARIPGDTASDSVTIASGHTVTFDYTNANALTGLVVTGTLQLCRTAGTYTLTMGGHITGAGSIISGDDYPSDCLTDIYINGNYNINGPTLTLDCYMPAATYVRICPQHNTSRKNKAITGVSNADPCVITCPSHGFQTNDIVHLVDIGTSLALNDQRVSVKAALTTDTFSIKYVAGGQDVDSSNTTAFGTYSSGGWAWIDEGLAASQTAIYYENTVDLTGDPEWTRSGATVSICNLGVAAAIDERTVSSVSSTQVTVGSATAGGIKYSDSLIVLTSRNIRIRSSSTALTAGLIIGGSNHVLGCQISVGEVTSYAVYNCTGVTLPANGIVSPVQGLVQGNMRSGFHSCTSLVLAGIICGFGGGASYACVHNSTIDSFTGLVVPPGAAAGVAFRACYDSTLGSSGIIHGPAAVGFSGCYRLLVECRLKGLLVSNGGYQLKFNSTTKVIWGGPIHSGNEHCCDGLVMIAGQGTAAAIQNAAALAGGGVYKNMYIAGYYYGVYYYVGAMFDTCTITRTAHNMSAGQYCKFYNCTITSSGGSNVPGINEYYNTTFSGAGFSALTPTNLGRWGPWYGQFHYNHNAVQDAVFAITLGGQIVPDTTTIPAGSSPTLTLTNKFHTFVATSGTGGDYPVWYQIPITCPAGVQVSVSMQFKSEVSGTWEQLPRIQIVDAEREWDATPLAETVMTDNTNWQTLTVSHTPSTMRRLGLRVRMARVTAIGSVWTGPPAITIGSASGGGGNLIGGSIIQRGV